MTELDDVIGEFDAGIFAEKVMLAMSKIALATTEHGKKGKVTIELGFNAKKGSSGVTIVHKIKTLLPTQHGEAVETSTTETYMYVGKKGVLTITPEQQEDLFEASGNVTQFKGN